ncbi:hypothetical protein CUJ84_Chr004575 [Rhizobium leguminosarum]|uniref:Uncharacterized protein n=1 Tax=Rhizobium leguminosarum TaxID=384 RepID=A0A2K9Z9I5_RHILE|nr:hypothetical protein CUJ84_Chr004575 [Rhizobium leguminosarum]
MRDVSLAAASNKSAKPRAIAACACVNSNCSAAAAIVLAQPQIGFARSLEDTPAVSVSPIAKDFTALTAPPAQEA